VEFFTDSNDALSSASKGYLIASTNPELLMKVAPEYYGPRFDALAEERKLDDGTLFRGQEFRKVASFTNVPLFEALRIREGLLKGKKEFYRFLEKYPQYRTYDKRGGSRPSVTFVDGQGVCG
jgi:hypothetical protein